MFKSKKEIIYALLFSFICIFTNLVCAGLSSRYHLSVRELLIILAVSIVSMFVLGFAVIIVKRNTPKLIDKSAAFPSISIRKDDFKYGLLTFLIILLLWFPVLLAFYPSIFAYDVQAQLITYLQSDYSTTHPLLHTFFLAFFYDILGEKLLSNHTFAMAIASFVQMIIFSASLSYTILFLRRINVNRIFRYVVTAFMGISPIFSVLSISTTKDVMFAGFLGLLLVSVLYFELDYETAVKNATIKIIFMFSIIMTVLFRSNARYAVWVMAAFSAIKFIRQKKKTYVILLFSGIILSELIGQGLKKGLNASSAATTEMLSIPLQQLAFVYELNYETLSADDKHIIETIIPEVINYNRLISDPIKFTSDYSDHKDLFWKTYFRLFRSHSREYIEAFLQTNLGFLYVMDTTNATVYGTGYERQRGFLMTYTREGYDVNPHSFLPFIKDLYQKLYCQNDYQNNILLFLPCSLGLFFWIIVLCAFSCFEKKSGCLSAFTLILALGATTLLGPCAIVRYMLPYIVCVPALICSVNYRITAY